MVQNKVAHFFMAHGVYKKSSTGSESRWSAVDEVTVASERYAVRAGETQQCDGSSVRKRRGPRPGHRHTASSDRSTWSVQ